MLDIDTTDERALADALIRHGDTPFITRTASGKFHALYRHNGERRRIRPFRGLWQRRSNNLGFVCPGLDPLLLCHRPWGRLFLSQKMQAVLQPSMRGIAVELESGVGGT